MTVVGPAAKPQPVRVVAFYLPQFHPTSTNDAAWGKGFTEWTNVAKCTPRFPGHEQPHLPADLGFYDLRLPEARAAQSELAAEYGIDAFMVYHYWFHGHRELNEPVDRMLDSAEPGLPFALCWANEPWSRRWDGSDDEVLVPQTYSDQDDLEHIRYLATVFDSPRYLRYDGKPLFAVYRPGHLPDVRRTLAAWRAEAHRLGIGDLFLVNVEWSTNAAIEPAAYGFDAAIEFQPNRDFVTERFKLPSLFRLRNRLRSIDHPQRRMNLFDYEELVRRSTAQTEASYLRFAGVTPGWDNSARRAVEPNIYVGATPELYEGWLAAALERPLSSAPEKLVFINAWNEWAEGNHLEPDQRHGRAYLEATRRAVDGYKRSNRRR